MQHTIIYRLVDSIFWIYMVMLFVRILSSWVQGIQDHQIIRFISFYTDPYLNFFRRLIPPIGMMDISPMAAFFALQMMELIVKRMLFA